MIGRGVRHMNMDEVDPRFHRNWARIEAGRVNEPVYYYATGIHSTYFTILMDSLEASYRYDLSVLKLFPCGGKKCVHMIPPGCVSIRLATQRQDGVFFGIQRDLP